MDVFFVTQNGLKFCIELGYWDTILEVKEKIKKYQRIPVPLQTLFFQGNVLQDHLDIGKCKILHKSLVCLFVNDGQVLKRVNPPMMSNSIGDIIFGVDMPLTTEDIMKIQNFLAQGIINNDQSPPSDAANQIINGHQDSNVTVQELQTENMNVPMKRIVVLVWKPKAAMNRVMVVNKTDHVKVLRKLVQKKLKNQSQDGYFFIHKERILNEDHSFEWNGVGHTDVIEIVLDPWL
ncbi:Ubiquitin domain-containing protein 7SL RNA1 [Cardamine amara subsp. amara]|uniref:Ubiquitin domain-containing protein 7SL RNA1 n=1 Tax=Cardamine amara subsp. amara TaxID=228776 RepID=A0ABD1BEY9_CARAN